MRKENSGSESDIYNKMQVIKYVKRSKYSFHDFSAKHTPSATLTIFQTFY